MFPQKRQRAKLTGALRFRRAAPRSQEHVPGSVDVPDPRLIELFSEEFKLFRIVIVFALIFLPFLFIKVSEQNEAASVLYSKSERNLLDFTVLTLPEGKDGIDVSVSFSKSPVYLKYTLSSANKDEKTPLVAAVAALLLALPKQIGEDVRATVSIVSPDEKSSTIFSVKLLPSPHVAEAKFREFYGTLSSLASIAEENKVDADEFYSLVQKRCQQKKLAITATQKGPETPSDEYAAQPTKMDLRAGNYIAEVREIITPAHYSSRISVLVANTPVGYTHPISCKEHYVSLRMAMLGQTLLGPADAVRAETGETLHQWNSVIDSGVYNRAETSFNESKIKFGELYDVSMHSGFVIAPYAALMASIFISSLIRSLVHYGGGVVPLRHSLYGGAAGRERITYLDSTVLRSIEGLTRVLGAIVALSAPVLTILLSPLVTEPELASVPFIDFSSIVEGFIHTTTGEVWIACLLLATFLFIHQVTILLSDYSGSTDLLPGIRVTQRRITFAFVLTLLLAPLMILLAFGVVGQPEISKKVAAFAASGLCASLIGLVWSATSEKGKRRFLKFTALCGVISLALLVSILLVGERWSF